MDGDVVVIGASGLECVFLYRRTHDAITDIWEWSGGQKIVSSDYDFDYILGNTYMHVQNFGTAVALSKRTLVVGAPYADYGNKGETDLRETYDTNGVYNIGMGKGKAYVYYSVPTTQIIKVYGDADLFAGSFRVTMAHRNKTDETPQIDFDATASDMKDALENMINVDEVEVEQRQTANGYAWTVSFLTANEEHVLFGAIWRGAGCHDCTNFSATWSGDQDQVAVTRGVPVGDYLEHSILQAEDKSSADLFGFSVDVHYDQIAVGAPQCSVRTTTTWDFETGDLIGWSSTGTAFAYQPTFGENAKGRAVYGGIGDRRAHGASQHVRLRGRCVTFLTPRCCLKLASSCLTLATCA